MDAPQRESDHAMETTASSCQDNDQQEDFISRMPDDILLLILEKVALRNAVRARILSRRWKLLPSMFRRLVLDAHSFIRKDDRFSVTYDDLAEANATLVGAMRSVLSTNCNRTIRALSIKFYLRDDDSIISIGHLVASAMLSRKVMRAEFTILTEKQGVDSTDEDLLENARRFRLLIDACPMAFAGLTHLQLTNLRFAEAEIPSILSTCKKLKILGLYNCDSGYRSLLQMEHSELSELAILYCGFERVHLNRLPKLKWLTCRSWISLDNPLSFGHVPCLRGVNLSNVAAAWHKMIKLSELLANLNITDLHLNFKSEKIWIQPEDSKQLAHVLHKVRLLNLLDISEECDLFWIMYFLKAAPVLNKLHITVRDHLCGMEKDQEKRVRYMYCKEKNVLWDAEATNFKHHNLTSVTVIGFKAEEKYINFIKSVNETARNLNEIYLYDKKVCDECENIGSSMESGYPKKEERDSVISQLTAGRSSPIDIYFFLAINLSIFFPKLYKNNMLS